MRDTTPDSEPKGQTSVHPPIAALPDALTFRLARLVAVNDARGNRHFRENYGLALNEWRVLGLVSALQPLSFKRLRSLLLMDKGQLSRTVRQLVERGLLQSAPSRDDARMVELSLTAEGKALHDDVLVFTAARNEIVVECLTPEECREFMRILQKMTAHNEQLSDLSGILE